jgi:hypothetical protein
VSGGSRRHGFTAAEKSDEGIASQGCGFTAAPCVENKTTYAALKAPLYTAVQAVEILSAPPKTDSRLKS